MLILTRRPVESICIGDEVTVTVLGVVGNQVRFGIEAPREITIDRAEIAERKKRAAQGLANGKGAAPPVANGNGAAKLVANGNRSESIDSPHAEANGNVDVAGSTRR